MQPKGKILIVETDDLIRDLLDQWLSEAGYQVAVVGTGAAASGAAADLVIVNISNPRGADRLVRTLAADYNAPMLIVSARFRRGLGASVELAERLGVRKILPKPFTREELLEAVSESIGAKR